MRISRELKYFTSIILIFAGSVYFLSLLVNKYATLTFEHFVETCKLAASSFLSTGAHYLGLIPTVFVIALSVVLFLKSLFSYKKTQKKLKILLEKRVKMPTKLQQILFSDKISADVVMVVAVKKDLALTIGFSRPKIVVSEGLIQKLDSFELEAVILHEFYHLKGKHPMMLIVGEILTSVLFLLPILKDLTNEMRASLENGADLFTTDKQKTRKYLSLALSQIKNSNQFDFYPSLSDHKRLEYKFDKLNLVFSILTFLLGLYLFNLPVASGEAEAAGNSVESCGSEMCSTNCLTTKTNRLTLMSPAFQTTYSPDNH